MKYGLGIPFLLLLISFSCVVEQPPKAIFVKDSPSLDVGTCVTKNERIVNGTETEVNRYGFVVSLQDQFGHFCGGSLIAPDLVLSAAHCDPGGAGDYNVVVGRHNLNMNNGEEAKVAKAIPHPNYNKNTTDNDYLIIKLSTPVNNADIVELNSSDMMPLAGSPVTVAGWGATSEGGNLSSLLLEVTVNAMSNQMCKDNSSPEYSTITPNMLCASLEDFDSCQGDSGGPLFIKGAKGEDIQVGVVSWGIGCARPNNPGVYSRISSSYDWVKKTVCENSAIAPDSFECTPKEVPLDTAVNGDELTSEDTSCLI